MIRAAGEDLDEAPEHDEASVAVGEEPSGGNDLLQVGAGVDVALDGVVAAPEVFDEIAIDPARMGEELADGAALAEAQTPQVRRCGCVELDQALVDELHGQRGREELGDRADLEEAVRCGLDAGFEVEDTEGELSDAFAVVDPECGPGDAQGLSTAAKDLPDFSRRRFIHRA